MLENKNVLQLGVNFYKTENIPVIKIQAYSRVSILYDTDHNSDEDTGIQQGVNFYTTQNLPVTKIQAYSRVFVKTRKQGFLSVCDMKISASAKVVQKKI